ncbi:MAG: carbohydrate kinase family protein [Promethearchaeota archaeon]
MFGNEIELACIGSCCVDVIMNVQDVFKFEMVDANKPDIIKKYTAIEYSSKLNVNAVKVAPGGSAANVAANLANLGVKTSYIGKLGADFFGNLSKDDLKEAGVDVESCFQTPDDHTGVSVILITPFGKDRSILSYKGANNLIRPEEIQESWLKRAKNLQWTSLTSDSGVASIEKCIDIVKSNGTGRIFACPSISILKNNYKGAKRLIGKSDVLILNKEEIRELTGMVDILDAMKDVLGMGPGIVCCTDGKDGSYITDGTTLLKSRVYEGLEVVDTTGAGDAFASGVIDACMKGLSLEMMLKQGATIAAFECSELGVRDGVPHEFSIVEQFISTHPLEIIRGSLSGPIK